MKIIFVMVALFATAVSAHLPQAPNLYTCAGENVQATLRVSVEGESSVAYFSLNGAYGAFTESQTVTPELNYAGVRFWVTPQQGNFVFSLFLPIIKINMGQSLPFNTVLSVTSVVDSGESEEQAAKKTGIIFPTEFKSLQCLAQYIY